MLSQRSVVSANSEFIFKRADMSQSETTIPRANVRFGDWLGRGFQAFSDQWQNWLTQMLIAAGIAFAATLCLILPVFLVLGPLSCGLHYCGLRAVRGKPVDGTALRRGWETAGQSMIAYLGLTFLQMAPALVLNVLFGGAFMAMMMSGAMRPPGARPVGPGGVPAIGIQVEDFTKVPKGIDPPRAAAEPVERPAAQPGEQQKEPDAVPSSPPEAQPETDPAATANHPPVTDNHADAMKGLVVDQVDPDDEQAGGIPAPAGRPAFRGPGMPGNKELVMIGTMIVAYGLMLLGMLLMAVYTIWFGMRTMYVMPLIADRGCSFSEALTESWRLTKTRPWELLLVYFFASFISGMGAYFCYVGMLATLPIYFAIVAATYESHALPQFTPEDNETPSGDPA